MESPPDPHIERIRVILVKAISNCDEDVSDSVIWSYSDKQKKEWGVPTPRECERLKNLYHRIFSERK